MSLFKKLIMFIGRLWSGNPSPAGKRRHSGLKKIRPHRPPQSSSLSRKIKNHPQRNRNSSTSKRVALKRNHLSANKTPSTDFRKSNVVVSTASARRLGRKNCVINIAEDCKKTSRSIQNKIDQKVPDGTTDQKTGVCVGEITHFFSRIQVCVVKVSHQGLKVGDVVLISGKDTRFQQRIVSLQVESVNVSAARVGQLVGLKLTKPAKVGDKVFKM